VATAFLALLLIAPEGHAQRPGQRGGNGPEARIEQQVKMMTQQLQLSVAQQTQLETLLEAQQEQRREMMRGAQAAGAGRREAMREQMTKLRTESQQQIDAILTPGQRETRAKLREERQDRRESSPRRTPPARRGG
jgi:Spy/CpxP family protein refolding chaperone